MSTVTQVQWWHMAAKVLMVVSGGEYIVSKNLAGVFELMG